ncbi:uncharacterized protein LOC136078207 [Hydra vulgaris]|uniref:Uncharacterized protein LOC136078207 n=1 Tax=Hydra vulgaris TaxID=6087 RepID=A0ABM4BKB5_HYDVU
MPGRKKCFVATLFNEAPLESGGSKIQQVICKFCSLKLSKNGTRMTEHIAKCMKCGDQIKNKYLNDMPFKQKKVQTELMMEEDIPENLTIQCMEKKEKICLSSAILQIPIESFFRTPSCCGNQSRSTTPKFGDCKPNKTNSDKPPLKRLHSSTRVPFTPQKNKIASYIFSDKMTNEQIDESQMDLARAVYGTGCSLRVFENKLWIDNFAKLRPAFKLPNRDMLSNSLLERVYNETSTTVKELVGTVLSVAILCDGWSNIRQGKYDLK